MRFKICVGALITALLLVPVGTAAGQSPAEDQYTEQPPDPTGGTGDGSGSNDGSGNANNDGNGANNDENDGGNTSGAVPFSGGGGPTGAGGQAAGGFLGGLRDAGNPGGTGSQSSNNSDLVPSDAFADKSKVPDEQESLSAAAAEEGDGGIPLPLIVGIAVVALAVAGAGWWGYRRRGPSSGDTLAPTGSQPTS